LGPVLFLFFEKTQKKGGAWVTMVFSSLIFLWLFLPVVFVLNAILPSRYSNGLLLLASLIFYAWGEPVFVFLMALSIVVNWAVGRGIGCRKAYGKLFLALGVFFDLSILGYYKYAGFGADIINRLLPVAEAALPIGISFFSFQAISYLADVYRGETKAQDRLINVALYISFFPQLIAGPIVKYKDINRQLENRAVTGEKIASGFRRFIYGLAKKVLISNVLGRSADMIFAMDVAHIGGGMAWNGALLYTFQIYYDFSGYSDMAIGLGKMFGFDILENFNYPYLSRSIGEFWRRWHISLGSWFREYVYIPLGGNRRGKLRTYVNLGIIFFLTGLWHGANYTFILWGLYHGVFSVAERLGLKRLLEKSRVISHAYLFLTVVFGWVIFRADNVKDAFLFMKKMAMPWLYRELDIAWWRYESNMTVFVLVCGILGMGILQTAAPKKAGDLWKYSAAEGLYCIVLLLGCIGALASGTYNPFIYFQF
jgi:alginate O-acetyltransferase complex protein AlgI